MERTLIRNIQLPAKEDFKTVSLSFLYFFCLMTAYFILRPVRDEMGIRSGTDNLQWLFTGTFLAMLLVVPIFGWLAKSFDKKVFLPTVYVVFLLQLIAFYVMMLNSRFLVAISAGFYIWLSVFNLFIVSLFWSLMSDLMNREKAKIYFPTIAAGGTTGAIIGPGISAFFATYIGTENLLLIAAAFVGLTLIFLMILLNNSDQKFKTTRQLENQETNIFEGVTSMLKSAKLSGIGIFVLLYTCLSTFLYFEQAHIVSSEIIESDQRTTYFALRDIGTNVLTLALQFFITRKLIGRFGLAFGLLIVPLLTALLFFALGINHGLYVLAAAQILYRSGNHAIQKPSREILFTEVSDNERYQGKNFIDTAVYRGGDALSGWGFAALTTIGLSLSAIAFVAIPIALLWSYSGYLIGKFKKVSFA